jgi:putative hydrolase of the HAD superfamily
VSARFDAVLFDAGGVLVLPDPGVLGPLLSFYGGDPDPEAHQRAHYAGMHAKAAAGAAEGHWDDYDRMYVDAVGVREDDRAEAAHVLGRTRSPWLWRWPVRETRRALDVLAVAAIPMGVVSNASGQIEGVLARSMCQVGQGDHVEVRCVVDSHVVGVAKPDPAIFDHALMDFAGIDRARIAYVGDSVTMDVVSARAAGLHPILLDPYDDHAGGDFERVGSVLDLAAELAAGGGGRRGG